MVVVLPLVGLIRPKIHSQCVLTSLLINWKNVENFYGHFSLMIITIENLCYHDMSCPDKIKTLFVIVCI